MNRHPIDPPRLIPVLDLKGRQAVRAVAGERVHYGPLRSILHPGSSDPMSIARAVRQRLGLSELYLADLDAIAGAPPSENVYRALDELGLVLWLDAGVRSVEDVGPLFDAGAAIVLLGLETLRGPETLVEIIDTFGADRFALSLDLRDGRPLVPTSGTWGTEEPFRLAAMAIERGARRLLVLDLARVGTGRGVGTLPLLHAIRNAHPAVELLAGGGVASLTDVDALAAAGVSAVLVGAALHDGRIGADAIAAWWERSNRQTRVGPREGSG